MVQVAVFFYKLEVKEKVDVRTLNLNSKQRSKASLLGAFRETNWSFGGARVSMNWRPTLFQYLCKPLQQLRNWKESTGNSNNG